MDFVELMICEVTDMPVSYKNNSHIVHNSSSNHFIKLHITITITGLKHLFSKVVRDKFIMS